jgi:nucleoside-diphosphate-sugar epimerase
VRVALTGISGFIGSVLARHLHSAGHSVVGMVRSTSRRDHVEGWVERFVVGAQDDETAWAALLEGVDCVIHNSVDFAPLRSGGDLDDHLRSNLLGSIRLLRASAGRQFVFMSSVAVHHDMRPRWAGRVDEDHPLRPSSWYGAYKAAVEAHLWAAHYGEGQHTCALRPCAVYGIDPVLERSIGYSIVESLRARRSYRRPGGGKFVHVDDVAASAVAVVGNPAAAGRAYNLADCYARWGDWAALAAEVLGIEAEIDLSSPPDPKNQFTKDAAGTLGVALDRGQEGIRAHLRELIAMMTFRTREEGLGR